MMQLVVPNLDQRWEHIQTAELVETFHVAPPRAPKMQSWGHIVAYFFRPDRCPLARAGAGDNEFRDGSHSCHRRKPLGRALIEICERILGRVGVKPSERFLELGMSSLQLIQVVHAVAEAFSIRLKLSQLYAAASLRQCAELIGAEVENVTSFLKELV
jgi:acyl carrier protein